MSEPLEISQKSLDAFLTSAIEEFDAEKAAQELMARVPAILIAVEKLRQAQKISRKLLAREITI